MAHEQHHAIILGDDLADFPFMTVTEFGFGRMRPYFVKKRFAYFGRQADNVVVGAATEKNSIFTLIQSS